MTAKVADRRIQRTRALLLSALLDLIVERGYEDVSVQDIVDRANVGRSTFYKHFLDKRELLLTGVAGLQNLLIQQGAAQASSAALSERLLSFSLPLFQHVQGNIRFCRALLGSDSGAIVEPRIQRFLRVVALVDGAADAVRCRGNRSAVPGTHPPCGHRRAWRRCDGGVIEVGAGMFGRSVAPALVGQSQRLHWKRRLFLHVRWV